LGRKLGEYDAPRRLIEAGTGSKCIELFHSREAAECCGAGSVMFLTDPQIAIRVATKRISAIAETKSKLLITACQNCKQSLSYAKHNILPDIEVVDIVEFLARCV